MDLFVFFLLVNDHDFWMNDAGVFLVQEFPDVDESRFDVLRAVTFQIAGGVAGVVHELNVVADPQLDLTFGQS